jgi:SynChlorMet cassette protein ScmC
MKPTGYRLRLADGEEWHFVAGDGLEWLCEGLARIAGLSPSPVGGGTTAAFVWNGGERGPAPCTAAASGLIGADALPASGWTSNRNNIVEFWSHPGLPCVIGGIRGRHDRMIDVLQMQQTLYPVVRGAIGAGGLPVHAALVERDGRGVLIAAKGNTGKTTCCQRIPPPWRALCDDEAVVVPCEDRQFHAHPFPTWSEYLDGPAGRTWDIQQHVPLAAIFFLRQGRTDRAEPMEAWQAAASLYAACVQAFGKYDSRMPPEEKSALRAKVLDNVCRITKAVPAYTLDATLTGRFWLEIDRALDAGSRV